MNDRTWYILTEKLPEDGDRVYFQLANGTFDEGYFLTAYKIGQRKEEDPADKWFTLLDNYYTYELEEVIKWAYKNEL